MFSEEYIPVEDAITVLLRLYSQQSKAEQPVSASPKESSKEGQGDDRKDEPEPDTKGDKKTYVITLESSSDLSDNDGGENDVIWLD